MFMCVRDLVIPFVCILVDLTIQFYNVCMCVHVTFSFNYDLFVTDVYFYLMLK